MISVRSLPRAPLTFFAHTHYAMTFLLLLVVSICLSCNTHHNECHTRNPSSDDPLPCPEEEVRPASTAGDGVLHSDGVHDNDASVEAR